MLLGIAGFGRSTLLGQALGIHGLQDLRKVSASLVGSTNIRLLCLVLVGFSE